MIKSRERLLIAMDGSEFRRKIYERLHPHIFPEENFKELTAAHAEKLFDLYDEHVFEGELREKLKNENATVIFDIPDDEDALHAGCCSYVYKTKTYKFSFPGPLYASLFSDPDIKVLRVNGLLCKNRLECFQIVFEHELIHFLMMAWGYDAKVTNGAAKAHYCSHGTMFKELVKTYFGHTDVKHRLLFGDASEEHLAPASSRIGMRVKFKDHHKNIKYTGTITKIGKDTAKIKTDQVGDLIVNWHILRPE